MTASVTTDVECQVQGNTFFSVNVQLNTADFAKPFSDYMTLIDKARKVASRFGVSPAWTFKAFDYLVTYRLLDWLNPGYLRRYEQRMKRERCIDYWMWPSAVA